MAKQKNKYPKGYTGRDIIDEIAIANADRNRELYDNACAIPHYFGGVEVGEDQLKLQLMQGKNKLSGLSIIYDIIYSTENLKLDDNDDAAIVEVYGDMGVPHEFHPTVIKFIKSCIASSFNPNPDFSYTVSAFVTTFLGGLENSLTLPIEVQTENKTQKMILEELNKYFKKICDETNTAYSEAVTVPKRRKKTVDEVLASAVK